MNKKFRSDSVAVKLALTFVLSAAIQSILVASVLNLGGVIQHSRENAFQIFSEKVNSRKGSVEGEMKNVWTNFELYTDELARHFTDVKRNEDGTFPAQEELLRQAAPIVLETLYYTKTTGAFLILDSGGGKPDRHPALYFRNANPNRVDERNSNTFLFSGPWSVAEDTHVVTDAAWSYELELTDQNRAFYEKPFGSIGLAGDEKLLGYWCPPFQVCPGGEDVITYSVPLVNRRGEAIGVFGVEISLNYLYKYLPASELKTENSYGYIIAIRSGEDRELRPLVTHGALQRRTLIGDEAMELREEDAGNTIYRLVNHNSEEEIYACSVPMGMYYNNTPFSSEEWYLIGLMEGSSLLKFPRRIERILLYSLLVSLLIGGVIAVLISRWFTRFSRLIELSEVPVGVFEMDLKGNRVFMTNQVPRLLGLTREQERRFSRDQEKFRQFLREICRNTTDDKDVYGIERAEGTRWVRLTFRKEGEKCSGIVEDMTDDVLKTQRLRAERDYDGLTHVLNRKAFERRIPEWDEMLGRSEPLFVLMFDLNGLKEVNDRLGHNKGDEYIRFAAKAIGRAFPDAEVYRIGGDEFAAVLECGAGETLEPGGRRLDEKMEEFGRSNRFEAGVAWGCAAADPGCPASFGELLAQADRRMYERKRKMKLYI